MYLKLYKAGKAKIYCKQFYDSAMCSDFTDNLIAAIPDTSILDTSTEDADEPSTPRRVPAPRTTRRSSSSRLASTPAKVRHNFVEDFG